MGEGGQQGDTLQEVQLVLHLLDAGSLHQSEVSILVSDQSEVSILVSDQSEASITRMICWNTRRSMHHSFPSVTA